MARFFRQEISQFRRRRCSFLLGFFWCSGLLLGYFIYSSAGSLFSSMMCRIIPDSVSIAGLLTLCVLPFLISAFAVYIQKPALLYGVGFGKAFLIALISLSIVNSFAASGPLIRCILLFHDLLSAPILYWYWHRHISCDNGFSWVETLFLLSCFILIGSIDYCFISPLSVEFIKS